jgi:imidazolonepropionase-like amidohydrolase
MIRCPFAAAARRRGPARAQTVRHTGGTVALGDGSEAIQGGTVVIRDGRIVGAGASRCRSAGAE